ncbi:ATP-dependent DNA helicase MPH1 [Orchesella cincta]|uniref:ATP-dependent DNA helicase MPH1 n=1 Tax=Orchesella cincta TaxID=48709 RepID=A0A1D2M580_ORCCI|nr:ATP-dependent DNA helicase MPH1 [Orchesella cincta]
MFLLKRATMVVLVTTFGILLPNFYIQPAQAQGEAQGEVQAQAQGEVQAELQAKAQPEAQPAATAQGRRCYACEPCRDSKDLGIISRCDPGTILRVGGTSPFGWKKILASDLFHF